jgi:uncharacterized protein (TIGR03437 family)
MTEDRRSSPVLSATKRSLSPGRLILLLALASRAAFGQVTDFTLTAKGPHHVTQGHDVFFLVTAQATAGVDSEQVTPWITGLPSGATASWPDLVRFCCGTTLYRLNGTTPAKISTSVTTPAGAYPLTITYTTQSGVGRSISYMLYVDPVPGTVSKLAAPPDTPLASRAQWESNMTTYGAKHCSPVEMTSVYQGYVWYYDGIRIYHQIGDYTGDHATWDACAAMVTTLYRTYVLNNGGLIPGYVIFPKGLAMNYQRTGDVLSKQALDALRNQSPYASEADIQYMTDWNMSRELAYALETHIAEESIGVPRNTAVYNDLVEIIFGQFSQWILDKNTPYVQPFMVGLSAEALIEYWQQSQDPRVLPTLQAAADYIWAQSWDATHLNFNYYNDDSSITTPTPDLNLLIAPLYGWLFQQTGQQKYRDQGDAIFNAGVAGAWLGDTGTGGKQFSQNYRWSGKYLEWRSPATTTQPAIAITSPTTSASFTTTSSSVSLTGTASDSAGITQVTWTTDGGGSGVASGTTNWTINGMVLAPGSTRITVTAASASGNLASSSLVVSYTAVSDPAGPPADSTASVAITSPVSSSVFNTGQNTIDLGGTAPVNSTQLSWVTDQGVQGQAIGTVAWVANGIGLRIGSNRITVSAQDSAGNKSSASITVVFNPFAILTNSLPQAKVGKAYSYLLAAVGGTPPFTWSAGSMPDGLTISADGLLKGTPTRAGAFSLNLTVRDSLQVTATSTLNLQVADSIILMSAASLKVSPGAPESMVTALGSQLAAESVSATSSPFPDKLGETSVAVLDANGVTRSAALFYVSPNQINFVIPADTAIGPATVSARRADLSTATGTLNIVTVAPALFVLTQDGLAAAGVVRINGDRFTNESAALWDAASNHYVGIPIDLSSDEDQVYLTLYATGLRHRSSLDSVLVTIGDVQAPVVYAGPSGTSDGLDIVNVLLPPALRGKGTANIVLTVNGTAANAAYVLIR